VKNRIEVAPVVNKRSIAKHPLRALLLLRHGFKIFREFSPIDRSVLNRLLFKMLRVKVKDSPLFAKIQGLAAMAS
jgi:hypothetical protein